ncbi:hypothetical protein ALCH109712_03180 [Alkalicoccus chagannorensis]
MMLSRFQQIVSEATGEPTYPLTIPRQLSEWGSDEVFTKYQQIAGSRYYSHSGDSNLYTTSIQVTVSSKNYGRCVTTINDIIDRLSGYREYSKPGFQSIFVDAYGPDQHDIDTGVYQKSVDFSVSYSD